MARDIQHFNGTKIPVGPPYPFGDISDTPGANTTVDRKSNSDMQQFFQKLMFESGITPNNLPDNDTNNYQLYQALQQFGNNYAAPIILNMIGPTYDPTKVYILSGVVTRSDNGYAFYDGRIYFVEGNPNPPCSVFGTTDVLGATVIIVDNLQVLQIQCAATGSGIANYADVIRIDFAKEWQPVTTYSGTYINSADPIKYRKEGARVVRMKGRINNSSPGTITTSEIIFTLPAGYSPISSRYFACPTTSPITGINFIMCEVQASGDVILLGAFTKYDNQSVNLDFSLPLD